jgi:adenosylcobinamide kinase / adenosylcobinamide-phosphate guanylyltransferase
MARIALVTGGCRSGKSAYAQQMAEALPPTRLYVATSPVTDDEMRGRIEEHRQARCGRGWQTIEEQADLAGVLSRQGHHSVLLVDCITLWINNLLYAAQQEGHEIHEAEMADTCDRMLQSGRDCRATVIFVTNEVGLGVVPENALARRYRDLVGRTNQMIAARADSVTLMSCGIPWHLKGA